MPHATKTSCLIRRNEPVYIYDWGTRGKVKEAKEQRAKNALHALKLRSRCGEAFRALPVYWLSCERFDVPRFSKIPAPTTRGVSAFRWNGAAVSAVGAWVA